jgi:serine/threonine protein kinase
MLDICAELEIMAPLRFQHICQVYKGCVVNEKTLWLVLEFIDGGNLKEFLTTHGPFPFEKQLSFAIQATKAVHFLHNNNPPILHRDIKSYNFLVKDLSVIILTDFGLAKAKDFITSQTPTIGTLHWTAPEVFDAKWSEKADIYSLGMVFFEIISGEIPFQHDENLRSVMNKVENGIRPKIPDGCSEVSFPSFHSWVIIIYNFLRNFQKLFTCAGIKIQTNDQQHTNC